MSQGGVIATVAEAPRRGARFRSRLSERPLIWIAPLAFLLFASYIYPAIEVIRFSFTDATLLNADYYYTLDTYGGATENPDLPGILRTTLIFVAASVFF
jgi:multiple sugar transport system permease protein